VTGGGTAGGQLTPAVHQKDHRLGAGGERQEALEDPDLIADGGELGLDRARVTQELAEGI